MEQLQDTPTLVGAIATLIVAIALMIRQSRNGHSAGNTNGNGNGAEAEINVEVERRVKYHDLRNDIQKIALSVAAQGVDLKSQGDDLRNALDKFEAFRESVSADLATIKTTLKYYPFRPSRLGEGEDNNG